MSAILKPLEWFYHEFGVAAIHETGRNAYLIICARALRMFAYGTNSLILAIFFSALHYTDHQIGLFFSLTLVGDVLLGTFLTLVADRVGRRKVLIGGSFLMVLSGVVFAIFENFYILLAAAVVGVISVTGGDFGPFRSIEESVLSQLTDQKTRPDVLAWYVTISAVGSSIGSEVSGRVIRGLEGREGWGSVRIYHALFWVYAFAGVVNAVFMFLLTDACELQVEDKYEEVPQDETVAGEPSTSAVANREPKPTTASSSATSSNWFVRSVYWLSTSLSQISRPTRSIMYKLWLLLALDSIADGMVPYSLTNYYMDTKFSPSKSTLGDITSASYFLAAIGSTFAGPLARKIGLINTMVFTHVPSSAAVLFFPAPPYLWLTAVLLLVRAGLNNMDQAPRSAFIAAVVKPEERTAVMGITAMVRTLAATAGPTLTGVLAAKDRFWVAFVAAGLFRLAYDFGLYALFVNVSVSEGGKPIVESESEGGTKLGVRRRVDEEEGSALEMVGLAGSEDEDEDDSESGEWVGGGDGRNESAVAGSGSRMYRQDGSGGSALYMNPNKGLEVPGHGMERVRSRSPHARSSSEQIL